MICDLINPSDPYTMVVEDFNVGAVAVLLVGGGKIGLRTLDQDDELSTPILFGWEEWLKERGIDLKQFMNERRAEVVAALESVLIGTPGERRRYELAASKLSDDEARTFKEQYHDDQRSSCNNIGQVAWDIAAKLREKHQTANT